MLDRLRERTVKAFGDNCCTICMENLQAEDDVIALPCHKTHVFHGDCLEHFLDSSSKRECPLCRAVII